NQVGVNNNSPFGGVIVVQGPSFIGHKYRIRVTDTSTLASYYVNNDFVVVGWLAVPPYVQYTTVSADANFYYDYQAFEKNTDNVLARFSPGTNSLLRIDLEIEGIAGTFTKYLQMNNVAPAISLNIDDLGNCSHYKVGDVITGSFSVNDAHLLSYSLVSSFG